MLKKRSFRVYFSTDIDTTYIKHKINEIHSVLTFICSEFTYKYK